MISVSGLSGSKETAQSQVLIGMGLLAGSTVMLITLLWGSCIVVGKCDLGDRNTSLDMKDTKGFNLFGKFHSFSTHCLNQDFHTDDIVQWDAIYCHTQSNWYHGILEVENK